MTTITKKLVQRDKLLGFTILCGFLYFTSYIARLNFGAAMADIMVTRDFVKTQLGWVSTAGFITYGLGQFLFGYLGDRVDPRNLIFWGMIATAVCNLALPFASAAGVMAVIWGINGLAQSSLWPPLIRMMSERCTRDSFSGACVQVAAASSLGTIVVYLFVPLCIVKASWEAVFFISALCCLMAAAVWYFGAGYFVRYAEEKGAYEQELPAEREAVRKNSGLRSLMMSSGLAVAIGAIVLQGILRDGVITWTPTYLTEVFGVDSSLSILSSVVLPVFAVVSVSFASYLNRRFFHNEVACAAALFAGGAAAALLLRIFFSASLVVSVVLAALITAAMHGVNLMLISCVPGRFSRWGKVSTVSGILNAFTYLGSALSAYGIAYVAQNYGWDNTIALWAGAAFGGGGLCITVVKRWKRFIQ